jgi:hypothetical protein
MPYDKKKKMTDQLTRASSFIFLQLTQWRCAVKCCFQDETVWFTQRGTELLFNVAKSTLSEHL